jgi:2Fe-2S ferredoxin
MRCVQFAAERQCSGTPSYVGVGGLYPFDTASRKDLMTKITFVAPNGERIETEAENGATVMETAIINAVPGIVAECGGACTCATCHVYVDDAWRETVGGPSMMEEDMLDFAFDVKDSSRLSCQIKVKDNLNGLVVHVPSRQG